ncbi:MAG: hypothetical protein ACW986_17200 [Promethearchaeota archaeon]
MDKVVRCPECNEEVKIGVELEALKNFNSIKSIHFPHIHLHGTPLHGLLCYLNSELQIRNMGVIKSIEISRDSETLTQFLRKWGNPY